MGLEVMKQHRGGGRGSNTKRHSIINKQSSAPSSSSSSSFLRVRNRILPDLELSEKSKKVEKVRSLSAVDKALSNYKMTSHKNKPKFKLPRNKKVFNERNNGVDHASVPRKIRSAMKKRGRESISEKVNHKIDDGIESPQKDHRIKKKPKKEESPDWSTRQVVSGTITKDEEEVAETLYALAGMFPNNNAETQLYFQSLPNKNSSVLQDHKEESTNANNNAIFEASPGATEDVNLIPERGAVKLSSLNETIGLRQTDSTGSSELLVATPSTAAKMNLQAVPMMVRRSESNGKVALHDSELCLEIGLNVSAQSQISHFGRKPDIEHKTATGIDCKQEQHVIKYHQENESPALWPGLTSRASAGINASYSQSSAAKTPHWLNAAICASKQDLIASCSSGGKISEVAIPKKSWKRCAAHVHISQLIRCLKAPKGQVVKEPDLYEGSQTSVQQGFLMEAQNSNVKRNRISSADGTVSSTSFWSFPETKNGIPQHKCHYLDISQSQAPPTPGVYGSQKQSFQFLSLSAGGNGIKIDGSFNKGGSRLEVPFAKSQVPCFQSQKQQHGLMPIPTPQNQYASTSYLDQLPATGSSQIRLQQPHYYGTPLYGTRHYSSTASYKPQQQQSFWGVQAQPAPQGGSAINYKIVRTQYPNWQSGRHDTCAVSSSAQVMLPDSLASLESLSSKITSIPEQQPFTLASSLPLSSRTNGLDIHLASVCEESRGRFRSSTSSMQLLCDERI